MAVSIRRDESRPRELLVRESLPQITRMKEIATRDDRTVSNTDLSDEIAEAFHQPVFTQPLKQIKLRRSERSDEDQTNHR